LLLRAFFLERRIERSKAVVVGCCVMSHTPIWHACGHFPGQPGADYRSWACLFHP
jgi:hypothetical protein